MATSTLRRSIAVGLFDDQHLAQQAVAELRSIGFRENQIGIAAHDGRASTGTHGGSDAGAGAAAGVATGAGIGALWGLGVVSGVVPAIGPVIAGGALAAVAASAAAGAAVGGLAGTLVGLGMSQEEAKQYEAEFHAGRTIVTVTADGRYDEAVMVLRRFGAREINASPEI